MEQRYIINYFGEKEIGYFGTLKGAIKYAESFAVNLILSYKGKITIFNEYGSVVAEQKWEEPESGVVFPSSWEIRR